MKYIRTKDNKICLLHEDLFTKGVWWFETKEEVLQISCIPSDFGKVADAIEELCDEFVAWSDDYKTPINCSLKEKERYEIMKRTVLLGMRKGIKCWLKLAIWTGKGLIYVAKLNEKGELELL